MVEGRTGAWRPTQSGHEAEEAANSCLLTDTYNRTNFNACSPGRQNDYSALQATFWIYIDFAPVPLSALSSEREADAMITHSEEFKQGRCRHVATRA